MQDYIETCINSILYQTYDDIEIIIIDDGSVDKTLKICRYFEKKDSRIKVIRQNNLGVSAARNKGLQIANGEFLMFLDSDDFLENNKVLENFVDIFNFDKSVDLIYGTYNSFFDDSDDKILRREITVSNEQTEYMNSEEIINTIFKKDNYISSAVVKIYRHSFLMNQEFQFIENVYHEDEEWSLKVLLEAKRIFFYNEIFYMRRYRKNSIMTTLDEEILYKRISDKFFIADKILEFVYEKVSDKELINTIENHCGSFFIANMLVTENMGNKNYKKLNRKFKENEYLAEMLQSKKNKMLIYFYKVFGLRISVGLFFFYKKIKRNSNSKN